MARSSATAWVGGLAGVAVVGVIGYFLYKKFQTPRLADAVVQSVPQASGGTAQIKTLQHVSKGEKLATASREVVTQKVAGMKYGKVSGSFQDQLGRVVRQFTAPADGFYTGRILQLKNNFYGEVRPG